MLTECYRCKKSLVTTSEQTAGACLPCFPTIVAELQEANAETARNVKLAQEIKAELQEVAESNKLFLSIVEAEKSGAEACRRGAAVTDVPHPAGLLAEHWTFGWAHENLSSSYGKIRALMLWTTEHLAHVHELAKGYGHTEIATKLELIFQKVMPYVGNL